MAFDPLPDADNAAGGSDSIAFLRSAAIGRTLFVVQSIILFKNHFLIHSSNI